MRQYKNDTRLVISDGLLNTLDVMFPNKLPSFLVNEAEIAQLIGQQQVVTWIKDKQEELRNKSIEGDYLEDIYGKILMEIREKLINEDKEKKNKSGGSNIKLKRDSVKNTEFKKPKFLNNIISETNNTKTLQINFKPVKKLNNKLTLFDLKKIF